MILASSSLSSLGCWQLLVIRGLARVFLSAASRLTRTSRRFALASVQLKNAKKNACQEPILGLLACFADISSIKWYSLSRSINHCSARRWNWKKKIIASFQHISVLITRLLLKSAITVSVALPEKERVFGDCELNMKFMQIKTWSRANHSRDDLKQTLKDNVCLSRKLTKKLWFHHT